MGIEADITSKVHDKKFIYNTWYVSPCNMEIYEVLHNINIRTISLICLFKIQCLGFG